MLRWLAQFLTAPIVSAFLDAYKAKLAAANAQGAQAAELARAALLAEIEVRKSADAIIIAEQGRWYTAIIRPLLAAPVIIYLWKVIVWTSCSASAAPIRSAATSPNGRARSSPLTWAAARSRKSRARSGGAHEPLPQRAPRGAQAVTAAATFSSIASRCGAIIAR